MSPPFEVIGHCWQSSDANVPSEPLPSQTQAFIALTRVPFREAVAWKAFCVGRRVSCAPRSASVSANFDHLILHCPQTAARNSLGKQPNRDAARFRINGQCVY